MKRIYGIIDELTGEVMTTATTYHIGSVELVENYTWEESDYTDPVTGKNYITIDRLADAFNELCARTGMKKKALAQICGKNVATFSRYCSGQIQVPRLVWDKVAEYHR